MVEVIPVHTACHIFLIELCKVIINLEPLFINKDSFNICHESKFCGSNYFHHITVGTDNIETIIVKSGEVINEHKSAHEVCLIHVESGGKNINIILCIEFCIHEDVLVTSRSGSMNTCGIILITHEGNHIGVATESNSGFSHLGCIKCNGVHLTMCDSFDDKVFEKKELIVFSTSIDSINDSGNQILHTIFREKGSFKIIVLNSDRIFNTIVHRVECSANIGKGALQFTLFSFLWGELTCFSNLHKYFFNSFTKLKVTFLEHSVCVIEGCTLNSYACNAVNERGQELVSKIGIAIQHFTNFGNVSYITNLWNKRLIFHACICSDSIQNIKSRSIEISHSNSSGHNILISFT